jgi:predicted ABC-type ATPase
MFAGPNGSGKSTIKDVLPPDWLGVYVNADDIEKAIRKNGALSLTAFDVTADNDGWQAFLRNASLLSKAGLQGNAAQLRLVNHEIHFGSVPVNSYLASVLADFIRHKLLETKTSFTFETVMSSPDKVAFLQKAQQAGYRTYLYFVATEDPEINVSRVQYRVSTGGHTVPEEKIISRYARSLDLLSDAVTFSNRAYIFDNSGFQRVWIAEVTNGEVIEIKTDQMPAWFKIALWDKFDAGIPTADAPPAA